MRGESSADQTYGYDGKPVSERQSDVDRLLVDQDAPEEQRILGTTVSFPDAFRFKGAAPEVINSRYGSNACISWCSSGMSAHLLFVKPQPCTLVFELCSDFTGK